MKTDLFVLLTLALALSPTSSGAFEWPDPVPCEKSGLVIKSIITKSHYTLQNAKLVEKHPDGLLFFVDKFIPPANEVHTWPHADCAVFVQESDLIESIKKAVGGFDSEAADRMEKERVAAADGGLPPFRTSVDFGKRHFVYHQPISADEDPFRKGNTEPQTWEAAVRAVPNAKESAGLSKGKIPTPKILEGSTWKIGDDTLVFERNGAAKFKGEKWQWKKSPNDGILLFRGVDTYQLRIGSKGGGFASYGLKRAIRVEALDR